MSEDAKVKTKAAQAIGKTVNKMATLAPQYAQGKMQMIEADQKAKNEVQQLAAGYANKYSDIGHSYGSRNNNQRQLPGF
ncbi:MAG TPA: hypothetical protein V6D19_00495 [Stenomitos sp.]